MGRKKKRADGRVVITKTYNGTRKFFYGATSAAADRKREAFELEQTKNVYTSDILYDEWLDAWLDYIKPNVSAATYKNYESIANKHLRPVLGRYSLAELNSPFLREYLREKKENGLSARSVEYIHTLLKASLRLAVDDDLLIKNPMDKIKKPKKEPVRKMVALTIEQVTAFLNSVKTEEYYRIFYIALETGFRRSEILGLRWCDIDYKNKTLTVAEPVIKVGTKTIISKSTKNKSSERTIYISDKAISVLKKQRFAVVAAKLKTITYIDNDLVFPRADGGPRNPERVSRAAKNYGTISGMPEGFSFHSLRHTHATLLLKAGVHFKVVQARLGHSTFQQTMDTYSHVTPDLDKAAAEKASNLFVVKM